MSRTSEKVRNLTAAQLGIVMPDHIGALTPISAASDGSLLNDDDPTLANVRDAMSDGYAGIILSGVPGTGKSRHASLIGQMLVEGDNGRLASVQFHPSYQYEDFVEGYVIEGTNFTRKLKTFGQLCVSASNDPRLHVLLIDEISRTDVARVFGEALTYIERSKRGRDFILASGTEMVVPENLFIIATMNPWDRGADELDMALERRFAFVEMPPSEAALREILKKNGLDEILANGVSTFFEFLQNYRVIQCRIGHGYFVHAKDRESLKRLWRFQLAHVFARACGNDGDAFSTIESQWKQMIDDAPVAEA